MLCVCYVLLLFYVLIITSLACCYVFTSVNKHVSSPLERCVRLRANVDMRVYPCAYVRFGACYTCTYACTRLLAHVCMHVRVFTIWAHPWIMHCICILIS